MNIKMTNFEPAQYIEELTFWVKPERLQEYIELDATLWVPALCTRKGFLGSEVWLGEADSGEITMLYFWRAYEDFAGLDEAWQNALKEKTNAVMGEDMRFIGQMNSKNKWRVRQYCL